MRSPQDDTIPSQVYRCIDVKRRSELDNPGYPISPSTLINLTRPAFLAHAAEHLSLHPGVHLKAETGQNNLETPGHVKFRFYINRKYLSPGQSRERVSANFPAYPNFDFSPVKGDSARAL